MRLPVIENQAEGQEEEESDEDLPGCWGKLWDPSEADCQKCLAFSSCRQEVVGAKLAIPERLVEPPRPSWPTGFGVPPQVAPRLGTNPPGPRSLLSVPEEPRSGESPYAVLGREIIRTTGKSFADTISNFFDHIPLASLLKKKRP